jgi:hypothetical protein
MSRIPALLVLACAATAAEPIALGAIPHQPLRDRIAALAPSGRGAALAMLGRRPGLLAHAAHLEVSAEGDLHFHNCASHPAGAPVLAPRAPGGPARAPIPIASPPAYSSLPGAPNTVYLDFNGEVITGTVWNTTAGVTTWNALPFDTDSTPTTFSDAEQDAIYMVWQRVAEDYRPFNVNVTTVLPAAFGPNVGRVLITRNSDGTNNCPSSTAGGVAYVGVFGTPGYLARQPAWVYFNNLGGGREDYVAEAASHEFGHNMGLSHDGTSAVEYYGGHGPAAFDWGPLMGTGYDRTLSQWSIGEYTDADNTEDDLAIINSAFGTPLADDHGDIIGAATALSLTGLTPQTITALDAVISTSTDLDVFSFSAIAGAVNITVTPRTVASLGFLTPQTLGVNLDARAELLDSAGTVLLTSNVADDTVATISGALPSSGQYYLRVRGAGNRDPLTDGYTAYGSLGSYRITGTIPNPVPVSLGFTSTSVVEMEGSAGARTVTLYVSRASGASGAASVTYDTVDQAATSGSGDYTAVVGGVLNWAPGDPLTKAITITVNGDTTEENDESFLVELSGPVGANLGANTTVMVALRNDDGASAALAASSAAAIQPNGTGDSGSCGAGAITGLLLGFGGLGLLRRRRR